MTYREIISLQEAKDYLGVDDTSRDDEINRMIVSAFKYMEKYTNHIFESQDIVYDLDNGCARIYDYPITTVSDNLKKRSGYSNYSESGADEVTLTVGYADKAAIPYDLLELGYQIIKFMFYEQEGTGNMPKSITDGLDLHKRFII